MRFSNQYCWFRCPSLPHTIAQEELLNFIDSAIKRWSTILLSCLFVQCVQLLFKTVPHDAPGWDNNNSAKGLLNNCITAAIAGGEIDSIDKIPTPDIIFLYAQWTSSKEIKGMSVSQVHDTLLSGRRLVSA